MKKVSEVIKALQEMKDAYGDLSVTITQSIKKSELPPDGDIVVIGFEDLHFGYDQFKEIPDEINIRNFPY